MREIPFNNVAGIILLPARADGIEGWLAFDTGAMQTALNKHYFPELAGEKKEVAIFDNGMADTGAVAAHLRELAIDGVPADSSLPVLLMDMDYVETALRTVQPDIRFLGSAGIELFRSAPVLLEYDRSTMTVDPPMEAGGAERIPLAMEALPVIPIEVGGEPHRFVLDTGANTCLLAGELSETIAAAPSPDVPGAVVLPSVQVGTHAYRDVTAVFTDISQIRGRIGGVDGVIGYQILAAQASLLDFRHGALYLF